MKKIVASVGLAALGASSIQTASAQALPAQGPKPWGLSAALNGFYDDNINSTTDKQDSFGVELSPSITFATTTEQTSLSLGYTYSVKYYDQQQVGATSHYDQQHIFNGSLVHAINEKDTISVSDSFVIGQEPDVLRAGNTFSTYQFVPGYNIRNFGAIGFDAKVTRLLGLNVGYDNGWYDYKDDQVSIDPTTGDFIASAAGSLNRIEQGIHIEGRWELRPETFGVLGFRYRQTDFTQDQPIAGGVTFPTVFSDARNSRSYAPYVGVIHTFTPKLSGSLNIGPNYAEYPNDPNTSANWSPYVSLSAKYNYGEESYFQVGFTQDRNATDVARLGSNGTISQDQESSTLFASVNHRLAAKLYGSIIGQFQNSTFNGGDINNESEQFYMLGLNLEYRFDAHLSAHVGYNYDKLESPSTLARSFDRNRVYLGLTASY